MFRNFFFLGGEGFSSLHQSLEEKNNDLALTFTASIEKNWWKVYLKSFKKQKKINGLQLM